MLTLAWLTLFCLSSSETLRTARTLTPPSRSLPASLDVCTASSPSSCPLGSTPCRVRVLGSSEAWRRAPASGSWGAAPPPSSPPPAPPAPSASRQTAPSPPPLPRPARRAAPRGPAPGSWPGGAPWRRKEATSRPAAGRETRSIRSLRRSRDVIDARFQSHDETLTFIRVWSLLSVKLSKDLKMDEEEEEEEEEEEDEEEHWWRYNSTVEGLFHLLSFSFWSETFTKVYNLLAIDLEIKTFKTSSLGIIFIC